MVNAIALSVSRASHLVLLVDADPESSGVLLQGLGRAGLRLVRASNVREAMLHLQAQRPDMVLLDARLPQGTSWQVLVELRRLGDTPLIMLSAHDQDRLPSLRMGADDYVAKPCDPAEVLARVLAVLRRSAVGNDDAGPCGSRILQVAPLLIDFDSHEVKVMTCDHQRGIALTPVEFKLLAHLARTPRRVASRAELLYACLPEGHSLERTVDSHVSRLRKKLERAGVCGMPLAIRGVGYKLYASP